MAYFLIDHDIEPGCYLVEHIKSLGSSEQTGTGLMKLSEISTHLSYGRSIQSCIVEETSRSTFCTVGRSRPILSMETYRHLRIPIEMNRCFVDRISEEGYVEELQAWKDSGLQLPYTEAAVNSASANGHVAVLEWWKLSGLPLKYTENAILFATIRDRDDTLSWWRNSGLSMLYPGNILDYAILHDSYRSLGWWLQSRLVNARLTYLIAKY